MPDEPANWKQKYGPLILQVTAYLMTLTLGVIAGCLGVPAPPPIVVTEFVGVPTNDELDGRRTGWVDEPEAVRAVADGLPIRVFAETPAFRLMGGEPDHVYLWDAAKKATGEHIPTRDQGSVGSCVAFGSACAVEYLQVVQMANGIPGSFKALSQEVIYGGSRVEIGGGRIRGDGSVGAWGARWCKEYGVIARGVYGNIDLTSYDESRCREYGRDGCPDPLEPTARERPVKSITQVTTVTEARKALANGYPVTVASNVGFGMRGPYTRDKDGFLKASGSWAHQMCFIGYRTGDRPGFYCMNSWGPTWVGGPTGPGEPPPGGFWVDDRTAAKMLSQGDSWAYGDLIGFPPRKLDWLIRAVPRREADVFVRLLNRPEVSLAW